MAAPLHDASLCPRYHHAIELIGRRWTGAILQVMRGGVVRFSDLAAAIPGLSDRMLSERLKELESERLVDRRVIPETPVRVEYRLTPQGEALGGVLDAVANWAHTWLADGDGRGDDDGAVTLGRVAENANGTVTRRVGRRRSPRAE